MLKRVLFVCVHNAGRSQMAEAFFNRFAAWHGLKAKAESAGTEPGVRVHPEVVIAMQEVGIDLSTKQPKSLTGEMVEDADRVFTMGCAPDASTCPAILFKKVEDWALADPHGQPLPLVREIREEIRRRVEHLVEQLEQQEAGDASS